MNKLSIFLEIPLAILSFCFYKVMKFFIGNLYTLYLIVNKDKSSQWRVLSDENLKSPLSLPVLMTKGPRWNTHAIIGTLGPFKVQESLAVNRYLLNTSAKSWIFVVYSFPDYQTITNLDSNQINTDEEWIYIKLKPGYYSIGLRYYHWSDNVYLPSVKVDDRILVEDTQISQNVNDFYKDLIKNKNWFYLSLHYYIFTILRLRKWLPESFVRNEYLPVGAPDTEFFYGYLKKGQSLEVKTDFQILEHYDIYFTLYDRSSLPMSWCQITAESYLTQPIDSNGSYLFRIRLKTSSSKHLSLDSELLNEQDLVQQLNLIA